MMIVGKYTTEVRNGKPTQKMMSITSTKPLVGAAVATVTVAQQLAPPLRAAARGAHRLLTCPVSCGRGSVVVLLLFLFHRHGAASSLSASARAKFLFLVVIVVVTIIWLLLCLSPLRADVFAGI